MLWGYICQLLILFPELLESYSESPISSVPFTCSTSSYRVLGLVLRSLIQLQVSFMQAKREGATFSIS